MAVFHRNCVRKDRFWYCGKKRMILRGKNWSFKRGQKLTFSKGVSPWILSKNRTFSLRRISEKSYQKRWFLILRKEKNDVKRKKLKFFKGPKNKLFLRGSVHGFCPKIELIIIAFFFYRNYARKGRILLF